MKQLILLYDQLRNDVENETVEFSMKVFNEMMLKVKLIGIYED